MDKNKLKEDLNNLSLSEVCEKYDLSLNDLFNLTKKGLYTYIEDDENSYVAKTKSNTWRVSKSINGCNTYFGSYHTKEDALKVRDELIKYNWNKNKLNEILLKIGVERL